MKTQLPHVELEQFMKDNVIRDKDYTLHQLYMLYQDIMGRGHLVEDFCQMSEASLERRAYDWPWLIRSGVGDEAKYAKRACKSLLTWTQVRAKVRRVLWVK